ncbi:Golgi apparatus membrane protein TVP18 [Gigaspora margarita]|uniref:Golgi apparatus membrane protein TVP18 n=1 Tax=Gigaspora margarita TaxID=4874 RepID=A0A8H3XCQ5_GIGMA|nr:Golgi apparatus membrane protein TVP18 [Gigaspora margarita]
MGFIEEFKSKNFSIYGQWLGLLSLPLLFIIGIVAFVYGFIFSILSWIIGFILIFVEIPLCTKVCPTSQKFDSFVKIFENHWTRTVGYLVFAALLFVFTHFASVLYIIPGITLLFTGICYAIAGSLRQEHAASSFTGGSSV